MRFAGVAIPDLTAALHQRGFAYVSRDEDGWLRYAGCLRLEEQAHRCELAISPRLDDFPRVWLTPLPPARHELLPHLSSSGYLCYLAQGSVVFDSFNPIGQTMACLDRAEQVLEQILAGKMVEDLAEEFHLTWGRVACLLDVNESKPGTLTAFALGPKMSVVTDAPARTHAKLQAIGAGLPATPLSAFRVQTTARPTPLQNSWPPRTVQQFLQWQGALDPACRKRIEQRLLQGFAGKAIRMLALINSPTVQYGIEVALNWAAFDDTKKRSLREVLYSQPIRPISVYAIDDKYLAGRNLPGSRTLAGRRVGLIGCGTIGGFLAEMLVKAGAGTVGGQLTIVDPDTLGPHNLGRHRLSFHALLQNKANAMAEELRRVAPGIDVIPIERDAKEVELGALDLLIDSTGEQALTDWLAWKYSADLPFLSAWVEGSGGAVRALLKAKHWHACPRCVSQPPLLDQYRVFDVRPEVVVKGHGCEGLYVPFPAWVSVQAAALAMEMVQSWLDDADAPSFRTHVLDRSRKVHFEDCSPMRNERCPACAT